MALDTTERQHVVYFTGEEVEHTVCHGMKTLFVVGTPTLDEILSKAKEHEVEQIYFGTSQSFQPELTEGAYEPWNEIIFGCLKEHYWVALDFGVEHIEGVLEEGYSEYEKFVPMISVKIPYISQLNYNATLKIDDLTWGASNPGVWTHHLQSLLTKENYTHWGQYTVDKTID